MKRENSIASLPLASIKIDPEIQQRMTMLNSAIVAEYAEAMRHGNQFPPVVVFYDGSVHWLADGYHRFEAADEASKKTIAAEIREGTKRDAVLFACGANRDHGLRRSREDVRRAIETLLKDIEWGQWSDRVIAERVGASPTTVGTVRGQLSNLDSSHDDQPGDDQEDQVSNLDTCDDDHPADDDADQLGKFPSSTDQPTRPAPKPEPPKRIGRDGKSYPATSKPKAPTSPPAKPKAPPAPTPTVNKPKAALDASLALTAAIGRLRPLVPDLLPEDALRCLINLQDAITLIEGRFGKGAKGHA